MDLLNFKSNSYFDTIINKLIDNELNYDQIMKSILNNEITNQQNDNQSNEYFINYFLNSLHLSCYWIINSNQISKSTQNSPTKSINQFTSTTQMTINQSTIFKTPIKQDKLEVKRNLFETTKSTTLDSKSDSKLFGDRSFESRFTNKTSIDKTNLNLNDDELFPKLNTSTFIKTPSSAERKLNQSIQLTSTINVQKSNKKQRRINPTNLTNTLKDNKDCLRKTLFNEVPEIQKDNLTREDIKKMAKDIQILTPTKKIISTTNIQNLVKTPIKNQQLEQLQPIQPSLDKITIDKIKFLNFIKFYTNLIELNLIPNILVELDFLLQLITKRLIIDQTTEFLTTFQFCSNYHNCVYFSIKSLELLYDKILNNIFDEQFFKTLSLNESIKQISPEFQLKLQNSKDEQNLDEIEDLSRLVPAFDFVSYEPEKDSRENFPDEQSYQSFRKQRDAFFTLHYHYKDINTKKCFKQESIINDQELKFTKRVSFIFSVSNDFLNYFHFARIFLEQLMQCCVGANTTNHEQFINDLIKEQTNQTPNVNENKMKKLNRRFNQPEQKVLATQSSFTGEEIFFYEFIISCNDYNFLTILQGLLISKIQELNDVNLLIEAIELDESNLQIATDFCLKLLNLQLLAKFLGLIVFMPFYSKLNNNNNSTINLKNKNLNNNLNEIVSKQFYSDETSLCKLIKQIILDSLKRRYLITTIPWIIQFLNQMDSNTSILTNYDQLFNILIDIYHELGFKIDDYKMNNMNYVYLKLVFGNFFEKYFHICSIKLFEIQSKSINILYYDDEYDKSLDSFQLINKKFLNACFPKLFIMKEIIKQATQATNEIRRTIKPLQLNTVNNLNESLTQTPAKIDKKNLIQIEFEENFFRLHADSLRKTIEFVADRLHSKCIKNLRYELIKQFKKEIFDQFNDLSKTSTILELIKDKCLKYVKEFSESKIEQTIDLLVSEHDFSEKTINIAKSIALRILIDKCLNWMSNNVNDVWIINETLVEINLRQQKTTASTTKFINQVQSNQQIPNISNCFNRMRDLICDLLLNNQLSCSKDELIYLIDELNRLRNLKIKNTRTNQIMETTMLDLMISLIAFQPLIIDTDLILKFLAFYLNNKIKIFRFISHRNLYILSLSKESFKTWDKFESIIVRLTQKEIYQIQQLESDLLGILSNQDEWDENLLRRLASCIKSAIDVCKSDKKFKDYAENIELIDWLSWFCGHNDTD